MKEIASDYQCDDKVGPVQDQDGPLLKRIQNPDFVVIVTSKQHEYQKSIDQEQHNEL